MKWESKGNSYTKNRMMFDFGFDLRMMNSSAAITRHIGLLDEVFHLVMVSDRFDESMILLKILMGWTFKVGYWVIPLKCPVSFVYCLFVE